MNESFEKIEKRSRTAMLAPGVPAGPGLEFLILPAAGSAREFGFAALGVLPRVHIWAQMGNSVGIESKPGQENQFWLELPEARSGK